MLVIFWSPPPPAILQVGGAVPPPGLGPFLLFPPPPPPFSYPQEVCHPCMVTLNPLKGTTLPHSPGIKGGAAQSYASPA